MACKFSINFNGPVEATVDRARRVIENQNGIFNGDKNSGNFEVALFGNTLKGRYTVEGKALSLEITDKPFFVPCSTIESFLLKQITT